MTGVPLGLRMCEFFDKISAGFGGSIEMISQNSGWVIEKLSSGQSTFVG
jgi:hypothetical protein